MNFEFMVMVNQHIQARIQAEQAEQREKRESKFLWILAIASLLIVGCLETPH